MRACKILSRGEFITDFNSGSGTAADKRTRSAKLAGVHAAYELKKNIMSVGMRVRSERRA